MSAQPPNSDGTSNDTPPASDSGESTSREIVPFGIGSTYRAFRESIVSFEPGGRLMWDTLRIVGWTAFIVGLLIFLTGMTTPLVAVMSGSMEPNINTGDGVITTKYQPGDPPLLAKHDGIITVEQSRQQSGTYTSFGKPGDVIVFEQSDGGTAIIHRAHFYVEDGENWVDRADEEYLGDSKTCAEIVNCPAPNSGYITKGDNNAVYDQVKTSHKPVSRNRVIGVGQYRIPHIGWIQNGIDAITPW